MPPDLAARLDRLAARLPRAHPGPGGAVAVLREGEVLLRHAWGFANAERRLPFTPRSLFRICSVTKHLTCAALFDALPDPAVLDGALRARLPLLEGQAPSTLHLCHNQSGLRDYFALAMLQGSPPEAPFGAREAARVVGGTRTLHFAPGTRFSYGNQNFRLLSDLLEERTGRGFDEILRDRVFAPAGMGTAILAADTRALPDGTEGYEGSQETGFRPAENRLVWTGDAGVAASLDDLIAWERHVDATRDDPLSLHRRLAGPVAFEDGAPAWYGFGLSRSREFGRDLVNHGGALRGWRCHRIHAPAERLSVVVLFNHSGDAHAAALEALAAALGEQTPQPNPALPAPAWLGAYVEPGTGLAAQVAGGGVPGTVTLRFGQGPERLRLLPEGGGATNGRTTLRPTPEGLRMERPQDNHAVLLRPNPGEPTLDMAGRFRCAELDGAELEVAEAGGALYGAFSGFLGGSRMELLEPLGPDVWMLPCHRALDVAPPGRWTLAFRRDGSGRVSGARVGCWLARGLDYARVA